jgi:hypothetical protein
MQLVFQIEARWHKRSSLAKTKPRLRSSGGALINPTILDGAECSTVWGAPGSKLATPRKNCRVLKHGRRLQPCNGEAFTRHRSHRPLMHRLTLH